MRTFAIIRTYSGLKMFRRWLRDSLPSSIKNCNTMFLPVVSLNDMFSDIDLCHCPYFSILSVIVDPSDPTWLAPPWGPMSKQWSRAAWVSPFDCFNGGSALWVLRVAIASKTASFPS